MFAMKNVSHSNIIFQHQLQAKSLRYACDFLKKNLQFKFKPLDVELLQINVKNPLKQVISLQKFKGFKEYALDLEGKGQRPLQLTSKNLEIKTSLQIVNLC